MKFKVNEKPRTLENNC